MNFTTNDYEILKSIISKDDRSKGLSKANGTSIKELVDKTKLSDRKVRLTLKMFEENSIIEKGLKIGKADTFVLTEEGFRFINSIRTNIFGEVVKNEKN